MYETSIHPKSVITLSIPKININIKTKTHLGTQVDLVSASLLCGSTDLIRPKCKACTRGEFELIPWDHEVVPRRSGGGGGVKVQRKTKTSPEDPCHLSRPQRNLVRVIIVCVVR